MITSVNSMLCTEPESHLLMFNELHVEFDKLSEDGLVSINLFLIYLSTTQYKTAITYLVMSFGPCQSEMQILEWTANPRRKLVEGAGD